jgi:prophage regulatory protein
MFVSDKQIAARYGVARPTVWAWLRNDPTFPKPVSLSPGCTRWRLVEVETWERSKAGEVA